MNDFFVVTGWVIKCFEVFLVAYLLLRFKARRWSLFFGGAGNLKTIDDHELHSCFLSALAVLVLHFTGSLMTQHILTLQMGKMELRQFFYFTVFCNSVAFSVALIGLHYLRKCSFSRCARQCLYLTLMAMALQITQYVIHAVYDSSSFTPIYQYGVVLINLSCLSIVALYPVKMLFKSNVKVV
ncbi:hypothetical protein [Pseudoalteromonas sp. MMG005]|uniref:hypothetical protein n=1 Tax=Pseudoalteromonas sp. MMG005 TaxID=2822682 RepID=UPI001B3A52BB|nr:hypothetical protein [Pseudoalteromonas sp. MMG005]MBQ4844393.1 hypothetical protein [Pseudoalteromonas sp. MMG005]